MKIDYCYHTHTARCGHAQGADREYVEAAINAGIKVLGFSDHAFVPGFEQPGIRGSYEQFDDYVNSIRSLKEEYKDKIDIYVGFEAEYSDCLKDYYKDLLDGGKLDYLICGQHVFFNSPNEIEWVDNHTEENVKRYAKTIKKAIKSRLFKYIAHPDMFFMSYQELTPFVEKALNDICKCAKKYDVPLELNLHGVLNRKNRPNHPYHYPTRRMFELAIKYGCKIIIGVDAHNPKEFNDDVLDEINDLVELCKPNLIYRIYIN